MRCSALLTRRGSWWFANVEDYERRWFYIWSTIFVQRLVNNSYSGEHTPTIVKEEHYPRCS